ncbi:PKD domain-containing protein [Methylomagnum ishizawai]|uniref:PKD domain-containing protein n=1 Tax=Methylomagnum ishizawai TaxID=1760988 RepID=UPI001C32C385|nr:hypothetical protein [Methylomagnum ishizawai]BBL73134.1 hypothetical protein MishRS11D_02320 [Methylomagnum ishizawai]
MKTTRFNLLGGAGLCLLLSTPGAEAAIADGAAHAIPTDTHSGSSGELFLNVWDPVAAKSYSLDLGVTAEDFLLDASGRVWHLDPRFKALAAAGNPLRFNIAANNTYGGIAAPGVGAAPSGWGFAITALNDPVSLGLLMGLNDKSASLAISQISAAIQTRVDHLNLNAAAANGLVPGDFTTMADFAANLSETTDSTNDAYGAYFDYLWGIDIAGNFGFSTAATVRDADGAKDQKLRFFFLGLKSPGVNKLKTTDLGGGTAFFSLNPANATLLWSHGGRGDNLTPVAVPGPAMRVEPGATVVLDGSASYDPDYSGDLGYAWTQASGPAVMLGPGAGPAKAVFVAGQAGDIYLFQLAVTDAGGRIGKAYKRVVVPNHRPVAVIDGPATVAPGGTVNLDGGASYDPDAGDGIVAYQWVQNAGPATGLGGSALPALSFTAGAKGSVYQFSLVVTDNHGLASVQKKIRIKAQ